MIPVRYNKQIFRCLRSKAFFHLHLPSKTAKISYILNDSSDYRTLIILGILIRTTISLKMPGRLKVILQEEKNNNFF